MNAVEAVTRELGTALHASTVSFLIADLSGRALVRLAHIPLGSADGRRDGAEAATLLPFDGGPQERALRTQVVQVSATPFSLSAEIQRRATRSPGTPRPAAPSSPPSSDASTSLPAGASWSTPATCRRS